MLLNSEELLALVHGDAEPDRLADLLDRLERCPESTAALQVLVTLRAHREEALETLRSAAEHERVSPVLHPATIHTLPTGWALQGLRLAASVAVVTLVGFWAVSAPVTSVESIAQERPAGFAALATSEYSNSVTTAPRVELTAQSERGTIDQARLLIEQERAGEAIELLVALDSDALAARLFLGMAQFFSGQHAVAVDTLSLLRNSEDTFISRQAQWYEANALLALERPLESLILLARLKSGSQARRFKPEATAKYAEVAAALGLNVRSVTSEQ